MFDRMGDQFEASENPMILKPLPSEAVKLLRQHNAPPRLVAHLELVHDVAHLLVLRLHERLPNLEFDESAVLMGAATHDIGKAICRDELVGRGALHEEKGRDLLIAAGFPESIARFAYTHGGPHREPHPTLEDMLVRTADAIWKGGRYKKSETEFVGAISQQLNRPEWDIYLIIDDILTELAADADARLAYQSSHPA